MEILCFMDSGDYEMEEGLISIIIPVYNSEMYLDRCLKSVVSQTYSHLEIILVDDGSSDKSSEICDEWALKNSNIKTIHKSNGGPSSARNVGMTIAKGEYISFVDSDDWVLPIMFEKLYELIKKYDADYSECEMQICKDYLDSIKQPAYRETVLYKQDIMRGFFRVDSDNIHYCTCGKLFKKRLLNNITFWEGKRFEDIYFNYQVLIKCNLAVYTNLIGYCWYYNMGSITRNTLMPEDMQLIQIWKKIRDDCIENHREYIYYSEMNYERAFMGLLAKGSKFGISDDYANWESDQYNLLKRLRKYFRNLMNWNMPFSRKVLLILMCINPKMISEPFRIARALKKSMSREKNDK